MVEILRMSKPIEKGGVILPADFRQYFGYGWDMLYGTFVLTALCLVTWLKLDSNFYLLLIVTYVDVFVVFDTVLSIYICSYQLVQIMYVNRVIEVCCIALQRLFHLTTQLLLCAPFLFFLLALKYPVAATLYKVLCIFRIVNLLMPERKSFSSSKFCLFFPNMLLIMR